MNKKLTLVAASMFVSSVVNAHSGHLSQHELDYVNELGMFGTKETQEYIEQFLKNKPSIEANASNEPRIVDVGVIMHQSWIDQLKTPISKDANGKYYENGAQFAIARIKAQFDFFNETLAMQNVNARLRPAFFSVVNSEMSSAGRISYVDEGDRIAVCTFFGSNHPKFDEFQSVCQSEGLNRVRNIIHGNVDTFYYVRGANANDGTTVIGLGSYYSGIQIRDFYPRTKSDVALTSPEEMESRRSGIRNASTFSHEFGHVFGAQHEVNEKEPVRAGDHNRAYACGRRIGQIPNVDPVAGDLKTMRPTIMWSTAESDQHRFFSDEDIVVDGFRCGVRGEANNIDYVRQHAPLVAQNYTMRAATSNVIFVQDRIIAGRQEGKATVTLRRSGDLSQPAYLSMTAKDGTAWENRDFTFGLNEVAFAAGESEKTIDVTLLPRTSGHPNTTFNLVFHAAIGATYAGEVEITIVSDKAVQSGAVQFNAASTTVTEGATASVQINRVNGTDGDITFKVTPTAGTAVAGTDFTASAVVKTMKEGESSVTFDIPTTLRSGTQGDRTVNLSISEVTGGAQLGSIGQAVVTIQDAVQAGTLNLATTSLMVNEGGVATLSINRSNGSDGQVSVRVQTIAGSAIAATDFVAIDQVVTIPAGQSTATVSVNVPNRAGTQGERSFDVQLSNATGGATLGTVTTTRITVQDVTAQPPSGGDSGGSGGSGGSMGLWSVFGLALLAIRRVFTKR